jgi:2,3-bisphosphoglycerate-independent phosphoglycerate mutase|tara:strand:+ start:2457 stop:2729 length:273 start_codon:yes stop_codon:yes gene_type:complete
MSEQTKEELQRFTTLVNPTILSHIKLISYFTNQKLYEVINSSLEEHISKFEIKNKTSISSIIDFQHNFSKDSIKDNLPKENKVNSKEKDK